MLCFLVFLGFFAVVCGFLGVVSGTVHITGFANLNTG